MDLELTLDAREAQGKANKRLRRAGIVPGVVYGKGEASTNVQVNAKTFDTLYRAAGRTSVVKLRLPGSSTSTSGFIKSVQRHPLSGQPLHVDYLLVSLTVEMEVEVPLVFTGEAPAVEETGGTLLHNLSSVRVKALPNDIPHEISVDVSVLKSLDVAIHVRDLSLNRDLVHLITDGRDERLAAGRGGARAGRRRGRGARGRGGRGRRRRRGCRGRRGAVRGRVPLRGFLRARVRLALQPGPSPGHPGQRPMSACTSARMASTSASRM